ncbi:protein phosphatase 1 regulatory subunit sds22-related [Holotrichia oblita]|uniref:Protein phosphatase 1 regulatory subunit sds22-related n=1 Tax=Holotrichia oblita TaxID=644536 RepID=A0ACB9TXJ4_HOLOL|nr:protein phosphatase 1 regulatory subunit sds22-related [Holotrichia oblita]
MDPCAKREPQVIDHYMIEKCLEEQGLKGEAGRLARLEGIPWDEVEKIRLEFMNILRIDHLWVLPGLTKLSLSNNLIEKIENLETLVNLVDLDLSFNKIMKIENLDGLVNLKILTLFENNIDRIENLDSLKDLMIFSIGNNQILNRNYVIYLRKFQNLKSVNLAGNPCTDEPDFRLFVATFLPKVVYYEYKLIQPQEREEGSALFRSRLLSLEEIEAKEQEIIARQEAEEAEAELHAESFVEFLGDNHLFEMMFHNDTDGKTLLKIGDEAKEIMDEFEEQFLGLCKQVFDIGQEQYQMRRKEIDQFTKNVDLALWKSQQESIGHMDTFMERKKKIFAGIKQFQDDVDNRELTISEYNQKIFTQAEEYTNFIHETWLLLMGLEMTVFEQMEEVNQTFEHTITEMLNTFVEAAQAVFTQMRTAEQAYMENIMDCATRYMTSASLQPDFYMPKELKPILAEKEILSNSMAASHDMHLLVIDNREDRLVNRAKTWLSNLVSNLQKDEVTRNRTKVLEINHFLDIQREEFDELAAMEVGPSMDPDITAALS